ncbi:MAG: hypothetical protein CM1200mP15_16710 [Dehalococcoidia bacterium]|nr:MAG: hypothetical protein CM1200mP15_16710 [Dehalococcoidia bacterium]
MYHGLKTGNGAIYGWKANFRRAPVNLEAKLEVWDSPTRRVVVTRLDVRN